MKNKRKILVLAVVIVFLFIALLTFYKFYISEKTQNKEVSFLSNELIEDYNNDINPSGKDIEIYSENVIKDIKTSYDFEFITEDKGIVGSIFIKNGYIYAYDKTINETKKIYNEVFKTLYTKNDSLYIFRYYAISESGDLYVIYLKEANIEKIQVEKVNTKNKVTNFTTLKYKYADDIETPNIIVIESDNNAYDISTGVRYSEDIINFYGQYYIYKDNTISNYQGRRLKYKNGEDAKIKYFLYNVNSKLFEGTSSLIITKENKIIYIKETTGEIFVYNKNIKSLSYSVLEDEYKKVNLKITLDNYKKIEITSNYIEYYGFE